MMISQDDSSTLGGYTRAAGPVRLLAATLVLLGACSSDTTEPLPAETAEVGVVLASTDVSVTIFDVEDPEQARTVGLGPEGSPVSMAVRGALAAIPLGFVPALAVVDLKAGTLLNTIALTPGSGATGVAFLNDSIVLVANPSLNSVTPVNVLRGSTGDDITVGRFPQAVVAAGGRAYVLNAELESFVPDGPSKISVLDAESLTVTSTIILSGENAAAGVVGPDGLLYVLHSGSFGAGNGSLSVVDPATLTEVEHHEGFGDFPGALTVDPLGDLFIGAFSYGVVIWSPTLDAFVRGLGDAITPGGVASTSGLGFDEAGRLYTLTPDCQDPATANRHDGAYAVELTIAVGICPFAISFGSVEQGN
jgi:hypothetical protein